MPRMHFLVSRLFVNNGTSHDATVGTRPAPSAVSIRAVRISAYQSAGLDQSQAHHFALAYLSRVEW